MRFQTEVTIARPRDDVFHRLADELARTIPRICPLTISVTLDSDKPIGAGTTGKMTLQNLFMSYIVDFEVTRYEQHEQFSLEARYRTRSAHSDYLFRDAGNGTLEGRDGDPTPAMFRRIAADRVTVFVMIGATLALAWFLIRTLP